MILCRRTPTPSTSKPRELFQVVDAAVDDVVVRVEVDEGFDGLVQEVGRAARALGVRAGGGVFSGEEVAAEDCESSVEGWEEGLVWRTRAELENATNDQNRGS